MKDADRIADAPSILLIEDDAVSQRVMEGSLKRAGWNFDVVSTGQQGLDISRSRNYDVVITDYMLPELDGLQIMKIMRARKARQAFIVVTGTCSTEQALELLRNGASDVLLKPVSFGQLETAVQRVLESVRRVEPEERLAGNIENELISYEFRTSEICSHKLSLGLLERLYQRGSIDYTTRQELTLVLDEALTNAIEHGNLELQSVWKEEYGPDGIDRYSLFKRERLADPVYAGRKVRLAAEYRKGWFILRLEDDGPGWSEKAQSAFRTMPKETEVQSHGRGLAIMRSLMDEIAWAKDGRELVMKRRL